MEDCRRAMWALSGNGWEIIKQYLKRKMMRQKFWNSWPYRAMRKVFRSCGKLFVLWTLPLLKLRSYRSSISWSMTTCLSKSAKIHIVVRGYCRRLATTATLLELFRSLKSFWIAWRMSTLAAKRAASKVNLREKRWRLVRIGGWGRRLTSWLRSLSFKIRNSIRCWNNLWRKESRRKWKRKKKSKRSIVTNRILAIQLFRLKELKTLSRRYKLNINSK